MSSAGITSFFPPSLNLLGGIPTKSEDLAGSVVFAVAYALLAPLALYRVLRPESRCPALLRPVVFVQVRLITFIIRAVQSNGNYATGLFIAEQILLLTGFIFLCEPLVTLTYHHIANALGPYHPRTLWLHRGSLLLQIALIASVAQGIAAGAQFSDVSNPSTLSTVKACRDAAAAICLAVVVIMQAVIATAWFKLEALSMRQTAYLYAVSWLLTVTSVYKIILYSIHLDVIGHTTKITFYVVAALPELVVVSMYLLVNVKQEFGVDGGDAKEKPHAGTSAV